MFSNLSMAKNNNATKFLYKNIKVTNLNNCIVVLYRTNLSSVILKYGTKRAKTCMNV